MEEVWIEQNEVKPKQNWNRIRWLLIGTIYYCDEWVASVWIDRLQRLAPTVLLHRITQHKHMSDW